MPVVTKNGYIRYRNGRYTDIEGKLIEKVGRKVWVADGWNPGEIVVMDLTRKVVICTAFQNGVSDHTQQTIEERDKEIALKILYKVAQGTEALSSASLALNARQQRTLVPFIQELLEAPQGAAKWVQTRERVWWGCYREGDRWELLQVVKKKTVDKYVSYVYFYANINNKEFIGRSLSLRNAQRKCAERAHRRTRWIPNNFLPAQETWWNKNHIKIKKDAK